MKEVPEVTAKQLDILLSLNNGIKITEIAKRRKINRVSVYKIIRRLKDKGLVYREDGKGILTNSKTNSRLTLTHNGRKLLRLRGIFVNNMKIRNYCEVCGNHLIINKHHIDGNRKNNHCSNIIVLCPTHHFLIHSGVAHLEEEGDFWVYKIKLEKKITMQGVQ